MVTDEDINIQVESTPHHQPDTSLHAAPPSAQQRGWKSFTIEATTSLHDPLVLFLFLTINDWDIQQNTVNVL